MIFQDEKNYFGPRHAHVPIQGYLAFFFFFCPCGRDYSSSASRSPLILLPSPSRGLGEWSRGTAAPQVPGTGKLSGKEL